MRCHGESTVRSLKRKVYVRTIFRTVAFLAAASVGLVPAVVRAQGVPANPPPVQCTESWLKAAMGRLSTAAGSMPYSGDLDADAVNAMMMIARAQSQAAAWEAKCGNNQKAKKKAQQIQWQQQSDAQALHAAEFGN